MVGLRTHAHLHAAVRTPRQYATSGSLSAAQLQCWAVTTAHRVSASVLGYLFLKALFTIAFSSNLSPTWEGPLKVNMSMARRVGWAWDRRLHAKSTETIVLRHAGCGQVTHTYSLTDPLIWHEVWTTLIRICRSKVTMIHPIFVNQMKVRMWRKEVFVTVPGSDCSYIHHPGHDLPSKCIYLVFKHNSCMIWQSNVSAVWWHTEALNSQIYLYISNSWASFTNLCVGSLQKVQR